MVKWISRIHWGKVLLVGLAYTVISTVVRMLEVVWTMRYYTMPQYSGVWNRMMMPTAGPPPAEFRMVSAVAAFATGVSLTIIYYYLRDYLPKGFWKRATYFADLMAATSLIFFTFPVALLFNVPYGLLVSWFLSTFVILVTTSIIIVRLVN